ncbi:hypothetical protein PTKIN_Ptkin06aG0059500 [Pterospermum kingtungense]
MNEEAFVNGLWAEDSHSNNATSEAQDDQNEPLSLPPNHNEKKLSLKRKQPPKAKGKGTNKRYRSLTGKSSASQQPEPKGIEESLKELIETKSLEQVTKIFKDRIERRKKKVDGEFMESFFEVIRYLVGEKQFDLLKEIIDSHPQIRERWPARSDLQNIVNKMQEIKSRFKNFGQADAGALFEIGMAIERPNEQVLEFLEKLKSLDRIFVTQQGVSLETRREKLISTFPLLFLREIATNGSTGYQDQGSLQTQEQPSSSIPPREIATNGPTTDRVQDSLQTHEQMQYSLKDCLEKTFAKDNNEVDLKHFQKEIDNRNDMEPIFSRIKQERGKDTEYELGNMELLVCAAVKQMETLQVQELKWDCLLKWGAVLNRAKDLGFEVRFAKSLLETKLAAYFLYTKEG